MVFLRTLNGHKMQGNYFSRPVSKEKFQQTQKDVYQQPHTKKPLNFRGLHTDFDYLELLIGTRGRIRTDKPSQAADFESAVYTVPPLWRGFEQYCKNHDAVKSKAGLTIPLKNY
jgi:hypothetical protein